MLLLALNAVSPGRHLSGSLPKIGVESHEHKAAAAAIAHLGVGESRALTILPPSTDNAVVALQTIDGLRGAGGTSLLVVPSLPVLDHVVSEFKTKKACDSWPLLIMASDCCDHTFQRTTRADECAEFIFEADQKVKPHLIISTYQSLSKVQQAAQSIGAHIDASVFLDAHMMAGLSKKTLGLHDENLAIQKRLFVTSIFEPKRYRKLGSAARSIDNASIFGDVVYHGTMSEAVQSEDAVPLQLLVCNGTSLLSSNHEKMEIESDIVESFDAVLMVAVAHAFATRNLTKAISFHRTRAEARNLKRTADVLRAKFGDEAYPEVVFLDGDMGAKRREHILEQVRQSRSPVVLANAGLLQRSIGFPEVDLVMFASPKYDHANILNIAGMATVPAPGKKSGHVLLPAGQSFETDFQAIIAVLRSLIADNLQLQQALKDAIIGAGKLNKDVSWSVIEEHLSLIGIDTLRREVKTSLFELLDMWYHNYGRLLSYIEEHGDCMVPRDHPLYGWADQQRQSFKDQKLSSERFSLLENAGFVWELFPDFYMRSPDTSLRLPVRVDGETMYHQISLYQLKHGHCYPDMSEEHRQMSIWLDLIRSAVMNERERLSDYLIARIDKLAMDWAFDKGLRKARRDAVETWEKYFKTAESHFQLKGHLIPFPYTESQNSSEESVGVDFHWWLEEQRLLKGRLNVNPGGPINSEELVAKRVARLNAIGMQWNRTTVQKKHTIQVEQTVAALDKKLLKVREDLSKERRELKTIESESFEQYRKKKYTRWKKLDTSFRREVELEWSKERSKSSRALQTNVALHEKALLQTEKELAQIKEDWHLTARRWA